MINEKIEIVYKNVDELREYKNNPRNNEKAVAAVAASIELAGFKVPIVIDVNGVIVAGHTRVKAAKQLGKQTVPCIVADDLTDEQIRAFRLADNKTSELADWDFDKLDAELEALAEMGIDMAEFGFSQMEEEFLSEAINDSGLENTAVHEYKLSFGNKTVIMTEDEYNSLLQRFEDYVDENGVSFGFVRWLLSGKG